MNFFEWSVVGAGPAGIAAVGKLLDAGVDPHMIAWFDPSFKVGDFGTRWASVSSNTKVRLFTDFLEACESFDYKKYRTQFNLDKLDANATCSLADVAEPLAAVTEHLCHTVVAFDKTVEGLRLNDGAWQLQAQGALINSKAVILALGAEAKQLDYQGVDAIELSVALSPKKLTSVCQPEDKIAVFGASHSGVMAVRNLLEAGVKHVINFYLYPLKYAIEHDGNIIYNDTGLKAQTANWARKFIDGHQPDNLTRVYASEENVNQYLPQCNKMVSAIGFNPRSIPVRDYPQLNYDPHYGIIAPGLFGFGIAFPEKHTDPAGLVEYRVGLYKFMAYLKRVLPIWQSQVAAASESLPTM